MRQPDMEVMYARIRQAASRRVAVRIETVVAAAVQGAVVHDGCRLIAKASNAPTGGWWLARYHVLITSHVRPSAGFRF